MPDPNHPDRRTLICCQRGPEELRPVLHLAYPPSAQSTLEVPLAPGVSCEVLLPPRYTLFLLLAAEAWVQDEGKIESQRGFRTTKEIGPRVGSPPKKEPVSEQAVTAYVTEIRGRIKEQVKLAVRSLGLGGRWEDRIPDLIENGRNKGYRIGPSGLEIRQARIVFPVTV